MQPYCRQGKSDPFSRSNNPQNAHTSYLDDFRIANPFLGYQDSDVKNAKKIYGLPLRLGYAAGWPSQSGLFSRSNEP